MTPTTQTADRLVLEARPRREIALVTLATLVFVVLAGFFFLRGDDLGVVFLVFALSGPVYAVFFLESRLITLDRSEGRVVMTRRGLRGGGEVVHPLSGVVAAEVIRADAEGRAVPLDDDAPHLGLFRPVLLREDGSRLALSDTPVTWSEAAAVVGPIRIWLAA